MGSRSDDLDDTADDSGDGGQPSGRRYLLAGVGLLCLALVAAGLFAYLQSRDGDGDADEPIAEVSFGPEGDATSIPQPPPNFGPVAQLSQDTGTAGSVVTLQGVNFKGGKDFERVEIYWNNTEGKPLASAAGPRFSVQLTIPADAPVLPQGHHVIMAQKDKSGKLVLQTSLPFYVQAPRP